MNINNINDANNPIVPKRPVDKKQNVPSPRTGQTEQSPGAEETQRIPAGEETKSAAPERDTFNISDEPKLVEELTSIVENMEESPREDAVTRARERVEGGYYNTREVMSGLAVNLVNTERLID